ncbi:MAG: hypothetical protein ACHQYQ_10780, partial [Bacteriovoracales bacterium]
QTQWCTRTSGAPSRKPTAILSSSFPRRRPRFGQGSACNQDPELGEAEASRRARLVMLDCDRSLEYNA